MPNARVYTSALLRLLYDRTSSAAQRDGFERPGVALLKIMVSNSYPGSNITSREVNEARRPHTCSRPCAFEEKKKHEITGNSLIVAHTKEWKKRKLFNILSWRFRRRWLLAIIFFTFFPGEVPSATPQLRALHSVGSPSWLWAQSKGIVESYP